MSDDVDIERDIAAAILRARLFGEDPPRVGRLELVERLGHGAFGMVWRAEDPDIGRSVAVKIVRRASAAADGRWLDEARAQAAVVHPHVAVVHDVGVWRGHAYLVMELVEGRPLREWVEHTRPSSARILDLAAGIGRGLAAVHDRGLVHGDVKPDNIVVESGDVAKLLDFGVVEGATDDAGARETGPTGGTPRYMAPELLAGARPSPASDQYALALSIAEALEGESDRQGTPARPVGTRTRTVLRRATHETPAKRYASVPAFLAALQRSRRGRWRPVVGGLALASVALVATRAGGGDDVRCDEPRAVAALRGGRVPQGVRASVEETSSEPDTRLVELGERARAVGHGWAELVEATCANPRGRRCVSEEATSLAAELAVLEAHAAHPSLPGVFGDLGTPSHCRTDPDPSPEASPTDLAVLRRLGELRVAERTGERDAVIAGATEILARADVRDDLVLRARFLRGRAHAARSQVQRAEADLQAALQLAKSAGRDRDAVMILLAVATLRLRNGSVVEHGAMLDAAEVLAHRLVGEARDEAVFNVRVGRGRHLAAQGDSAAALAELEAAMRDDPRPDDPRHAMALSVASAAAGELGDHARASTLALEAAEALEARYGGDDLDALMSRYNAAFEAFLAGDEERAVALVDRVLGRIAAKGELDLPYAWLPRELRATLRLYGGDAEGALRD